VPEQTASTAGKNDSAPPNAARVWPADVPSEGEAEGILCAAFGGLKAADDPALDAALGTLTQLEKDALNAALREFDPVPLRRAATLRYRITTAVNTAPAPGEPIDAEAGRTLLAAMDEVLAAVAMLSTSPRGEEIEPIRRALVKEAVDFSELLQRLAPSDDLTGPAAPPRAASAATSRTAVARVVEVDAAADSEDARRSRRAWLMLAIIVVLGGAFHGYRWFQRPPRPQLPTLRGLPEQALGFEKPGGARMVISKDGVPLTADELTEFRRTEEAAGRVVREVAPGIFISEPTNQGNTP
jgi:hypothetical protein